MKKAPLYSRSPRREQPVAGPVTAPTSAQRPANTTPASSVADPASRWWRRHSAPLWGLGGAALAVVLMLGAMSWAPSWLPGQLRVTQDDIDAAVRESLEKEPPPSFAAKAYENILPSLVRVVSTSSEGKLSDEKLSDDDAEEMAMQRSLGTGVVIIDNGTILTSLHVVSGAKKIRVRFANGHESDAVMIGAQPENDLAVLRAQSLPDDLEAATMRSTADLRPGEHVIAVGYPFGIGPSVSYGVVSGLNREFRLPSGSKMLNNLIQFDAAANPGNSGGPLVTMGGEVVGIVTAILNPSEQKTFIGIGFAVPIENASAAAGMHPF
jgi:S1-C subfamily serine protease